MTMSYRRRRHQLQRLVPAAAHLDAVSLGVEHGPAALPQRPLVVDDEDADALPDFGWHQRRCPARFAGGALERALSALMLPHSGSGCG